MHRPVAFSPGPFSFPSPTAVRAARPWLSAVCVGLATCLGLAGPRPATAQPVPEALVRLDADNASRWIEPALVGLAPALTAGFFTSGGRGGPASLSLRLTLGFTPADGRDFTPAVPAAVIFEGESYGLPYATESGVGRSPTVAGSGPGAVLVPRGDFAEALTAAGEDPDDHRVVLPDGLELRRVPVPAVEAFLPLRGVGLQLLGRFFPTLELSETLGDASAFGFGALLTLSRFVDLPVVDFGVTALTQRMDIGDYLDASAWALGLLGSADAGPVRLYGHGTLGWSEMEVHYLSSNPDGVAALPPDGSRVAFRRTARRDPRIAVGAAASLGALGLSAELTGGTPRAISFRASFSR